MTRSRVRIVARVGPRLPVLDRLIEAERARSEAQARLSRWLGQDAYRPVAMKLPGWDAPPSLEVLQAGLDSHPSIAAARAGVTAQQAAVEIAEENKKPAWALDVGYGFRDGFLPDGSPRSDFVSLSVSARTAPMCIGLPSHCCSGRASTATRAYESNPANSSAKVLR